MRKFLLFSSIFLLIMAALLLVFAPQGSEVPYLMPQKVMAQGPVELVNLRDQNSKTYSLGGDQYALDVSIGSIHYQDNQGDWQDIVTSIMPSPLTNWDWEVVKGHWQLLINDDTTIAVGKGGNWIGFRYIAFGYLDWATKDYQILQTREDVIPVVDGNTITWQGIFYGVDLEYIYTPDGLKENLYISQDTREYLAAHPPNSYGLNNDTSYLVGALECDWQLQTFQPEDDQGDPIDWNQVKELIAGGVYWRDPILDKIITALPVGFAYQPGMDPEDYVDLRFRFYQDSGTNYLLTGARVVDLNNMPVGTIILDPTIDEQVGASADDSHEYESTGANAPYLASVKIVAGTSATNRYWGGFRWASGSFPSSGSTIDVCYVEIYITSTLWDDMLADWHFQDGTASPAQFSGDNYDITSRARTDEYTYWSENSMGTGWAQSPSMVDALQEVIDNYSPTAIVSIAKPRTSLFKESTAKSYDSDPDLAAKLHIEYTAGGCSPSIELDQSSWSVNGGTPVDTNTAYNTGLDWCTITNNSGGSIDIFIQGTDMTGGTAWDLSDDYSNGSDIYGMRAGLYGGSYNIDVKESTTNLLKDSLADSGTQDFGLQILTPTAYSDGVSKSGTVMVTAVCE